jgi:hypothetical protein
MSIDVTDVLEEKRTAVERAKAFAAALEEGNLALAECFKELAIAAKESAACGGYDETRDCLELIELLSDIGYSSEQ